MTPFGTKDCAKSSRPQHMARLSVFRIPQVWKRPATIWVILMGYRGVAGSAGSRLFVTLSRGLGPSQ